MKLKSHTLILSLALAGIAFAAPSIDSARIDSMVEQLNSHHVHSHTQGMPSDHHQEEQELRKQAEQQLQTLEVLKNEAFKAGLNKQAHVQARFQNLEAHFYASEYVEYLEAQMPVSDEELQLAYQEISRSFKLQQVRFDTVEQAKEAQQLLLKGLSFQELMARYPNSDQNMQDFISLQDLTPEIANIVGKMKRGDVSQEPVKYQDRFYLFKITEEQRNPDIPHFAQAKEELAKQIKKAKAQAEINKILEANGIVVTP